MTLDAVAAQFFENKVLAKDGQLAELGVKDGDEVAVVHRQAPTPPEVLFGDEADDASAKSQLPDRAQVDAITAEEAQVGVYPSSLANL